MTDNDKSPIQRASHAIAFAHEQLMNNLMPHFEEAEEAGFSTRELLIGLREMCASAVKSIDQILPADDTEQLVAELIVRKVADNDTEAFARTNREFGVEFKPKVVQ